MSILDATLARTSAKADTILDLSKELSMDAALVEKAVMVLAQTSISTGDTIELAAKRTGLPSETLTKISAAVGDETALSEIANALSTGLRSLGQGNFYKELLPFG